MKTNKPKIFEEQIARKPDYYSWANEFIHAIHSGFWTVNEFNFKSDVQQFKVTLSDQEREIIVRTLSAIGQIEIAVKKFWAKLGENLPHPSLSDLGYVMANTEVIHNNAYERLLDVLGLNAIFEENLKLENILVAKIKSPTVPKSTERIRLSVKSSHSKKDLNKIVVFFNKFIF